MRYDIELNSRITFLALKKLKTATITQLVAETEFSRETVIKHLLFLGLKPKIYGGVKVYEYLESSGTKGR